MTNKLFSLWLMHRVFLTRGKKYNDNEKQNKLSNLEAFIIVKSYRHVK